MSRTVTWLSFFNGTYDDLKVRCHEMDNGDWDSQSRPDVNFNASISAKASKREAADLNSYHNSAWFTAVLELSNGEQLSFRIDQRDAEKKQLRDYTLNDAKNGGVSQRYFLRQSSGNGENKLVLLRRFDPSCWMSQLKDDLSLAQLTIPGSHDSCATEMKLVPEVRTQRKTLEEQMHGGIRFLDVRCRHFNNAFAIHHGSSCLHMNFDDVMERCQNFLSKSPDETIVMSVKEEHESATCSRTFWETFLDYVSKKPNLWHQGAGSPKLGHVRGKIVLLRRFDVIGINALDWKDDAFFTIPGNPDIRVQDKYHAWGFTKKGYLDDHMNDAEANDRDMFLNYANITTSVLSGIEGYVEEINHHIYESVSRRISDKIPRRLGCIIMDYIESMPASSSAAGTWSDHIRNMLATN